MYLTVAHVHTTVNAVWDVRSVLFNLQSPRWQAGQFALPHQESFPRAAWGTRQRGSGVDPVSKLPRIKSNQASAGCDGKQARSTEPPSHPGSGARHPMTAPEDRVQAKPRTEYSAGSFNVVADWWYIQYYTDNSNKQLTWEVKRHKLADDVPAQLNEVMYTWAVQTWV